MDKKPKQIIANLLDLPEFEPERCSVEIRRLGIVFELQEIPYDKLVKLCRERDPNVHLILASLVNHPEIKSETWYHDRQGCATPVDALKKLLKKGEVDKIVRAIDILNGYGAGSVAPISEEELEAQAVAMAVKELEKN